MRVAIVDDHQLYVDGLASWLQAHAPDVEVVFGGADYRAALDVCGEVDVVVLDLDLGEDTPSIPHLVSQFAAAGPGVLVVSALRDGRVVRQAVDAGALGYVPKREPSDTLLTGLRSVAAGRLYLTRDMAAVLCESDEAVPTLSEREVAALRLYASGLKLDTVARRLGVAPTTAKEYLDRIRAKYESVGRVVRSRTELAEAAARDHLLGERADRP